MSWSVRFIGKPENVIGALDKHSETLTGQSKAEFDEAKPALQTLVRQHVGQLVDLSANGHATFTNGEKSFGNCGVTLGAMYAGALV
jgi:hypothetical protein